MSETEGKGAGRAARERVIVGVFDEPRKAKRAVETLIDRDYPMDMISLLGQAGGGGDDALGIYYRTRGERVRGWGELGAFWGGLWGLLASAAGLFVIPGIGPVAAAGPVVEALAGAAAGAIAGGGAMAGAATGTHLTAAMRRAGISEECLDRLHQAIEQGHYVLILRCYIAQCEEYRQALAHTFPDELMDFPFGRLFHRS